MTDDTPNTIPKNDWNIGRFRRGISGSVIMIPPVTSNEHVSKFVNPGLFSDLHIPAAPIPAIALPTINVVELGAAPQIALPISNTVIEMR